MQFSFSPFAIMFIFLLDMYDALLLNMMLPEIYIFLVVRQGESNDIPCEKL